MMLSLVSVSEQTSSLTPEYSYDQRSARYRDLSTGRYVSNLTIRSAIDDFLDDSSGMLVDMSQSLIDGKVSLDAYRDNMASYIKSVHLASAAAAKGGWAQLDDDDYQNVTNIVANQYSYLDGMINAIDSGEQSIDNTLLLRAGSYAQASRGTFHVVERDERQDVGFSRERNILDPDAEKHCKSCLAESARGWVPIGQLILIGSRECGVNDRCNVDYDQGENNQLPDNSDAITETFMEPGTDKWRSYITNRAHLQLLYTFADYTSVWIVNGNWIRTTIDARFTDYGQPLRFQFIPRGELWVDQLTSRADINPLIEHMMTEYHAMNSGMSYDDAFDIASRARRAEYKRSRLSENDVYIDPRAIKKSYIGRVRFATIWAVDGDQVRSYIDPDFVSGGHFRVYSWIPDNEIWIDCDNRSAMLREIVECDMMGQGLTYENAHRFASNSKVSTRQYPILATEILNRYGFEKLSSQLNIETK